MNFLVNTSRVLPGNRLEALMGDRKGQYSIRIPETAKKTLPVNMVLRHNKTGIRLHVI
jgi:plasmid maintenance system killer protein